MAKYGNGYSLAESLVTLFIVAVITTLALANYRAGQQSALLRQTTAEMVGALRDAQQHALSATCPGSPCVNKPDAYGVHFASVNPPYEIFADMNGNGLYNGTPTDTLLVNPSSERPSTVGLSLSGIGCSSTPAVLHITFAPPLPSTSIKNDDGNNCTKACLFTTLGGQTWRITVDQTSGLIESSLWPFGDTTCT